MKKLFLISMLFFSMKSFSQNAYYDAMTLSKYLVNDIFRTDSASKAEYSKILNNYLIKPHDVFTAKTIFNDYTITASPNFNPFLKSFFPVEGAGAAIGPALAKKAGNLFSSAGNLNVTNFADGLARFLVQRSKEELNVAFFRKFQDFLKKYPEVRIIFPGTVSIINHIAAYNYAAMLPALRASFQKDLNAFSSNLINLRETSSYEGYNLIDTITKRADAITHYLNETPVGRSLSGGVLIADGIVKGNNMADIISNVANDKIAAPNDNLSNCIQFVDLLSKSLKSAEAGRVWISKQQVSGLIKDSVTLKLYFGLLYADNLKSSRPLTFTISNTQLTLQSFLEQLNKQWNTLSALRFVQYFKSMANAAGEVADKAKSILDAKDENEQSLLILYADYAASISNFLKLSLALLATNNEVNPSLSSISADIQKLTAFIDVVTNSCYDLKSHNYGALIIHTSALLSQIPGCGDTFNEAYIKYGTFMANVVEAKSSDEVKAAIEAAVLPIGSSSIKRETTTNISLNAFIGPFGGTEYLPALVKNKTAFVAGITAPVGVAFSWGKIGNKQQKKNGKTSGGKSFTIFIPIIDVGSLASYRLGDDSSKVASEVTLSNIISPGLYFYYGLGKCPISIGIGGQVGPQLREVTALKINTDKNFYVRFGLNVVVDIPFFNFYSKN